MSLLIVRAIHLDQWRSHIYSRGINCHTLSSKNYTVFYKFIFLYFNLHSEIFYSVTNLDVTHDNKKSKLLIGQCLLVLPFSIPDELNNMILTYHLFNLADMIANSFIFAFFTNT